MRKFKMSVDNKGQIGHFHNIWQQRKKRYKTLAQTRYLSLVMGLVFLAACSSDNTVDLPDDDGTDPPVDTTVAITGITPESGIKETLVTINGKNFGDDMGAVQVFFNEVEATVQSVSDARIEALVPPRAYSGKVMVIIEGEIYEGPDFTYEISEVMVSTFAGTVKGNSNGTVTDARFDQPRALVKDSQGNFFIVDTYNHRIRKITPEGEVSTFAGSTQGFNDGYGTQAQFRTPIGIAIDGNDNLYVTDLGNNRIRKITPSGEVITIAGGEAGDIDGPALEAQFDGPRGVFVSQDGTLYISDESSHKIKKLTTDNMVVTVAGSTKGYQDGNINEAKFENPEQLWVDGDNNIFVASGGSAFFHGIRKISPQGEVSTLVGNPVQGYENGSLYQARFSRPIGVAQDRKGNFYISDRANNVIRKLKIDGTVITLAGAPTNPQPGLQDGEATTAKFNSPDYLFVDDDFTVYVADELNHKIRKITQE